LTLSTLSLMTATTSCIYDDRSDCILDVRFTYSYNVKGEDAFSSEIKEISLYIFDSEGIFVGQVDERGNGFPISYSVKMPSLRAGDYTFVALGRNRAVVDTSREFEFSCLESGESGLSDLTMFLNMVDNVCDSEIAALYNGIESTRLRSGPQSVTIHMKKLTNRFKIILLPYNGSGKLESDDIDIRIEGNASWLNYKGDKHVDQATTYLPFGKKSYSAVSKSDQEVSMAIVAELNTSRLLVDDKPTLIISNSEDGRELLRVNLAWLLTLQAIDEHKREWSKQEYLDRQDAYNLTFFVDNDLLLKSTVIINGWNLDISDLSLG